MEPQAELKAAREEIKLLREQLSYARELLAVADGKKRKHRTRTIHTAVPVDVVFHSAWQIADHVSELEREAELGKVFRAFVRRHVQLATGMKRGWRVDSSTARIVKAMTIPKRGKRPARMLLASLAFDGLSGLEGRDTYRGVRGKTRRSALVATDPRNNDE